MAPKGQLPPRNLSGKRTARGRAPLERRTRPAVDRVGDRGGGLRDRRHSAGSPTMTQLDAPFAARHIGPAADQVAHMLAAVGYGSVDELMDVAIPEPIRFHGRLGLPTAATEAEA